MIAFIKSQKNLLFLVCFYLITSCSATNFKTELALVGSTPGDEAIKAMLSIPPDTKIDFIKWELKLDNESAFVLDIHYGESQPNTLGFKADGQKQTFKGKLSIERNGPHSRFKEIYTLQPQHSPERILLVKINENIFHLLTAQKQLMVGNGGWSYSLNRKTPVASDRILIPSPAITDTSLQMVFDGRTPCQEFARLHSEMKASSSCFKLKWRLILNRDSLTRLPGTCSIRNIADNQPRNILCKWEIVKGSSSNPDAVIYKVVMDNLAKPILFFVADENVLYFVDEQGEPLPGNADFSFVLNRLVQN